MSLVRARIVGSVAIVLTMWATGLVRAAPAAPWLAQFPDDTTVLAVTDVKAMRASPLFAPLKKAVLDLAPQLAIPFSAAKLNLWTVVDRTALFVAGDAGGSHVRVAGFVVEGNFPSTFPTDQASAISRSTSAKVDVRMHGTISYLVVDDIAYVRVGRRVYVGNVATADELIAIAAGEPMSDGAKPAAKSPRAQKLRDAVAGTDSHAQSWAVAAGPTITGYATVAASHAVAWIGFALSLHKTADATITLRLADPQAAAETGAAWAAALPSATSKATSVGLADALARVTYITDGARLSISVRLVATELATLLQLGRHSP